MIKPKVEVLSKEEIEEIHIRSLSILSRVGVEVFHDGALKLLKEIGAEVDFNKKIAKIPEHLVSEALKKTPHIVRLYYRDGKRYIELKPGGNTYFATGSTGIYYMDWRTNDVRMLTTKDIVEVAKVIDALSNIHIFGTLYPSDVPELFSDKWFDYIAIKKCTKPFENEAREVEELRDRVKLYAIVVGEENVSKKPITYFAACPSPPLKWSAVTVYANLMEAAKYGLPVEIIPMPQTGATAPATIAGAVLQGNAEFLSGLVIAQFTRPGTPIFLNPSPVAFDQRYGAACTGSIEVYLMSAAFAQLARFYGVPSGAWITVSDSKVIDVQTGIETALGTLIAVLSGINIAIGAGMFRSETTISLIKLVIDDDIAGVALRFGKGVLVNVETLADWLIEEVGPGGLFLKYKHTREWWIKEHYIPKLLDKKTIEMWKRSGAKDLNAVAKEQVEKILKEHIVEPLPPDIERELDKTILEIAKKYKIEKLPPLPQI